MYQEQIKRIKEKLEKVREYDCELKVFGASAHEYYLGDPVPEEIVQQFETDLNIKLPPCYHAFITEIGNAGEDPDCCAAGPYYGIYPMGAGLDEYIDEPEIYLQKPVSFTKETADAVFSEYSRWIAANEDCSSEEYDQRVGKLFSGVLPINSQGCSYRTALLLNGPDAGRVIYCNYESEAPKFTFEKNFLDWYERWLDEILAGLLTGYSESWFGYTMGGDDTELLKIFDRSETVQGKIDALNGFFKLFIITEKSAEKLLNLTGSSDWDITLIAIQLLTKFDYPKAIEPLKKIFSGDEEHQLLACKAIYSYQKEHASEWGDLVLTQFSGVEDPELFRYMNYILKLSNIDYFDQLLPFCNHHNEKIRSTTLYNISSFMEPEQLQQCVITLKDLLKMALKEREPVLIREVLQAMPDIIDDGLPVIYREILSSFQEDEEYVLNNVMHKLRDYPGDVTDIIQIATLHSCEKIQAYGERLLEGEG